MSPLVPRHSLSRRSLPSVARALLAPFVLGAASLSFAFESTELNDAQVLVYETPHLASVETGDALSYAWTASDGADGPLEDSATLDIVMAHEDGTRDVELDFLSDERRLELPPFEGWRGNPILMATLERFAQDFAMEGGGDALYFRNRMRDAMADAPTTEAVELEWSGEAVDATRIEFTPFRNDPYVGARPGFAAATVRLELSEDVPGGVLSAAVESPGDDAGAGGYHHELRLRNEAGR